MNLIISSLKRATGRVVYLIGILFITINLFMNMTVPCLAANSVPEAVLDSRNSVVRIGAEVGTEVIRTGTGFVIGSGEDIYIVTNHHVIKEATEITIYYGFDGSSSADIIGEWIFQDVAVLRLREDVKLPPLPLSSGIVGDGAYSIGFPGSADKITGSKNAYTQSDVDYMTLNDGIVSSRKNLTRENGGAEAGVVFLQTNVDLNPGNSGGPLLNENGAVIGINTLAVNEANGMYFAVSTEEILPLLDGLSIKYTVVDGVVRSELSPTKPSEVPIPDEAVRISPLPSAWVMPIILLCMLIIAFLLMRSFKMTAKRNENNCEYPSSQRTLKKRIAIASPIIIAGLLIYLFALYTNVIWDLMTFEEESGNYAKISTLYEYAPWISLHDPYRPLYFSAKADIDENRIAEAKKKLSQIRVYRDSEKLYLNVE